MASLKRNRRREVEGRTERINVFEATWERLRASVPQTLQSDLALRDMDRDGIPPRSDNNPRPSVVLDERETGTSATETGLRRRLRKVRWDDGVGEDLACLASFGKAQPIGAVPVVERDGWECSIPGLVAIVGSD